MPELESLPQNAAEAEGFEEEKEPRKVFLEIGARNMPAPFFGKRKIGKNETYIDVDIDKESLASAKNLLDRHSKATGEGHHYFIRADAKNLPLADGSVDEIFMGNVLGDEMHIEWSARKKFIAEAGRALAKGGYLVILEAYTPLDYVRLHELLEGTDFYVEKAWERNRDTEDFERQRRLYGGEMDAGSNDAYIIKLRKRNGPQK